MYKNIILAIANSVGLLVLASPALSENLSITINLTSANGLGEEVGKITLQDTKYGLLLTPDLSQLNPGVHGFHIHENPSCEAGIKEGKVVPGLAAGGHYDPDNTGEHLGPYEEGHLGDLPPLFVTEDGRATTPVLAPRLEKSDVMDRSIMIHLMGDNYSDHPKPLGGGGARLACGVIKQ